MIRRKHANKTDAELIEAMANRMVELGDACTRETMLLDFEASDLDRLGGAARARAAQLYQRIAA